MKLANMAGVNESVETLEAIDYQRNDEFGPQLEEVIGEFVQMVKKNTSSKYIEGNKELKDKFNRVVLARTGINAYLITDQALAATMPNIYNPNSILASEELAEALKGDYHSLMGSGLLYNKPAGFKIGTVDYRNGKLGGWFSEQPVPVFINFKELVNFYKLTVPEITAVIMHELGHDFEGAAMVTRINTSNQLLSDAVSRINDIAPERRQEFIYQEFNKLNKTITREDIEGLQSKNPIVLGVSAFRALVSSVKSLSNSAEHDVTTYEALSDSFAVRYGYGEHLASGLDKMLNSPLRSFTQQYFALLRAYAVFNLVWAILKLIKTAMTMQQEGASAAIKLVLRSLLKWTPYIIMSIRFVNSERESTRDMTYDLDKDRFIRIRNDLINSLKDPQIDVKTRKAVLEQIKFTDEVISRSTNFRGYLGRLALLVSPSDKAVYNAIKAQQEMEKMVANDIFVSASKIKAQQSQ